MDDGTLLVFWLLVGAAVGGVIGATRNNMGSGVIWGALLGPIGWILVLFLDQRAKCPACGGRLADGARRCQHCGSEMESDGAGRPRLAAPIQVSASDKKKCPYCAELIQRAAVKCRYCGSDLTATLDALNAELQKADEELRQVNEQRERQKLEHPPATPIQGSIGAAYARHLQGEEQRRETPAFDGRIPCPLCGQRIKVSTLKRGENWCPHCFEKFIANESEMEKSIIKTVLRVMLPLGSDAASSDVQEKANQLIWKLVIPAPGKTEPEFSSNVARRMLGVMLAQMDYTPAPGKEDTIQDLCSDARLDLVILTAVNLVFGYKRWSSGQVQSVLDLWPAQEFHRAFWRENQRNWPERWKAAGGRFFPGKPDYPEGRMIALENDPIWANISAFGLPFPPFDFHSGMMTRPVSRAEAVELGLMQIDHAIQPAALSASDEFQERLAAKLHENLAKLEADEERRLSDPLNFGTGGELLRLAEEKIQGTENLSSEQVCQVAALVEKAVERGVAQNPDCLLTDGTPYAALQTGISQCRSLASIFGAINEPMQAAFYGQKAAELEFARLMSRGSGYDLVKTAEDLLTNARAMTPEAAKQISIFVERAFEKGVGAKYNLRAKAHKVLAQVYARTNEFEKAEANRGQYVENADGFLLLEDAKTELAMTGKTMEPKTSARILDMLAKAVQRLPENCPHLHAEAYRLTAEILEVLGDNARAIEYYEFALLKNPRIGVKRRLDAIKNLRSHEDQENLIQQCVEIVRSERKVSVSLLQRRLHLNYTDAAHIMDELENRGIVGPCKGALPRDILSMS